MSTYSVDGYISALLIRGNVTILVEGTSDKNLISRILLEFQENHKISSATLVIDTAELIKSEGDFVGNRTLVEITYTRAIIEDPLVKLHAIVDREFRGFDIKCHPIDSISDHKIVYPSLHWTRGHSAENYFFSHDFFRKFLKHQFSSRITANALGVLPLVFPSILRWACAVTLALKEAELITRAESLKKSGVWATDELGVITLSPRNYANGFSERGVNEALIDKLSGLLVSYKAELDKVDDRVAEQWLAHGHIGWEILWSGVAYAISVHCINSDDIKQIESGYQEVKTNCACDLLAHQVANNLATVLPHFWAHLMIPH
jgi:hypothetical protein